MGVSKHRTTLNEKCRFDQVALVAAAFLFISGFLLPSSIPWQLAFLTLVVSTVYSFTRKVRSIRQVRQRTAAASTRARHIDGASLRSR